MKEDDLKVDYFYVIDSRSAYEEKVFARYLGIADTGRDSYGFESTKPTRWSHYGGVSNNRGKEGYCVVVSIKSIVRALTLEEYIMEML